MNENPAACIKLGDNKKSILGLPAYQGHFKKKKRKRKRKEKKLSCHIDAIRQGLHKIFPQVNKNLVDLFEYLPHVLANSRANNPSKSYINYFIEW